MSALLVVRPSSLGDIVHALALCADVERARPGTPIDWIAEEAFAELPALNAGVRHVIPVALRRWRNRIVAPATWREVGVFRRAARQVRYRAVLDLQEQIKGAVLARFAHGPRHGLHRAHIREPIATLLHDVHHRVPRDIHFIAKSRALAAEALGYRIEGPPRWHWKVPATAAALPSRAYVVALTATSRAAKLWPEDAWRALVAQSARAGLATLLPWGTGAERARCERIAAGISAAIVPPRQTLSELATLLARAEFVAGVDTGLTHFAAALGTPTLALFTDTDPALAGVAISGAHARDLGGNGRAPTPDEALAAAGALLRAAPRC
jgi:heptosyltransferase-1